MCRRVDFRSIMIRSRVTNMQHGGQRSLPDAETADTCSDAELKSEAATCTTRPAKELSCACILLPLKPLRGNHEPQHTVKLLPEALERLLAHHAREELSR